MQKDNCFFFKQLINLKNRQRINTRRYTTNAVKINKKYYIYILFEKYVWNMFTQYLINCRINKVIFFSI